MAEGLPAPSFEGAAELVAFLLETRAHQAKHSGRTLLQHLLGTACILERWGAGLRACKTGLFHSIYGTQRFKTATLSFEDRRRVQAILGVEAARLAYVFCKLDRSSINRAVEAGEPYSVRSVASEVIALSGEEFRDLVHVTCANELEQAPYAQLTGADKAQCRRALGALVPFLGDRARRDLEAFWGRMTNTGGDARRRPGLGTLLNMLDPATFVDEFWPQKPFVGDGPMERLAGLADYDFSALVKMKKHHTTAFFKTIHGGSTSVAVAPGQEEALYNAVPFGRPHWGSGSGPSKRS